MAYCLTQLSVGLIITPTMISSQAAVLALQRLVSTPDQTRCSAGHPLPTVPVTVFESLLLYATSSLDIALRWPSSSTPIVAAPASVEQQGGARSPSSSTPVAAAPALAQSAGLPDGTLPPFSSTPVAASPASPVRPTQAVPERRPKG